MKPYGNFVDGIIIFEYMTDIDKTTKAVVSTLLGFLMLASISVFVKLELRSGASVEWIVFIQFLTSFILITILAARNRFTDLKTSKLKYHIVRGVTGVLAFSLFTVAISKIPLVNASLLNNSAPIFIPIVTLMWLKTKIDEKIWWGIAIGFLGIVFILDPSADDFLKPGDLYGLGAGISLAIAYVALGILSKTESFISIIFYYSLISVIIFLPLALLNWSNPYLIIWSYAVISGVMFVCYLFFLEYAYGLLPAVKLAPLNFSVVVFTGILDWIIFGHVPNMLSLLGIILVIVGGILAIVMHTKDNEELKPNWH